MRADIMQRYLNLSQCPEETRQFVLRLADGDLSPEEEEKALAHVASCDSCRYYLELYGEFLDAEKEETEPLRCAEISVAPTASGLVALVRDLLRPAQPAFVLSGGESKALEYEVPFGDTTRCLRIIRTGERLTVEIETDKPDARYYLMSENTFLVKTPYNGRASFEGVPMADILVSENMDNFVKIGVSPPTEG